MIEGFLLSCKVENKSPATTSFYKNILDKFQWFLGKFSIDTIDTTSIRQFLVYLKDTSNRWDSSNTRANRPVSAITVRSYYSGLSALFTWSMEEELIETNPMANVKKPQLPHKTVKGLEPDIIHELLNSITDKSLQALRNKAILYMFLDTGLRLSELTNLTISDISKDKDIIKVVGKGNKERYVRIGVKTQKALWVARLYRVITDIEELAIASRGCADNERINEISGKSLPGIVDADFETRARTGKPGISYKYLGDGKFQMTILDKRISENLDIVPLPKRVINFSTTQQNST
ncbi:tyrosine-type recombinase/integrase [Chloroflexota bacterium]